MVKDSHCVADLMILALATLSSSIKTLNKTTWFSPNHHINKEIDYTFTSNSSRRWHSLLQNIRVSRGTDCGSDYFLFMTKTQLKFKKLKTSWKGNDFWQHQVEGY